jgi:hypothetical protein
MRRIALLPTPQGIGAGQTATLNMALGPTYNRIDIRCNANISGTATDLAFANWPTVFGDIRIMVDGNTKIEATAEFLAKRAQQYGYSLAAGVLPIFLAMPWARTITGEDIGAYGTAGGMSSFTLEMDIKAGQTINALKVYSEQTAARPFMKHTAIRRFAKSFGATGLDEVSDLPRGAHNLLALDITHANIGDIEVFASGSDGQSNRIHNSDKAIRAQDLLVSGRVQQAALTHIDFAPRDRIYVETAGGVISETQAMALNDFRLRLQFEDQPDTYNIYETSIMG